MVRDDQVSPKGLDYCIFLCVRSICDKPVLFPFIFFVVFFFFFKHLSMARGGDIQSVPVNSI